MNSNELRALIPQKEGLRLDFKREYKFDASDQQVRGSQRDEFIKDVLALTNGNVGAGSQPAYLVIGVGNDLHPDGSRELFDARAVEGEARSLLDSLKSGTSSCSPPLPDFACEIVEIDGLGIVVITIPFSPHLHEITRRLEMVDRKGRRTSFSEGTVFIRRNESVYPAREVERRAILAEKSNYRRVRVFSPRDVELHRSALAQSNQWARWSDSSRKDLYIHGTGMHLPLFASPYGDLRGEKADLLETMRACHRLLVLGEPGMGKTVALERMVWEVASSVELLVPVYVPLIHYEGDLIEAIRIALNGVGALQVQDRGEAEDFIGQYRCVFLFDGLNEVPKARRESLCTELGRFLHAYSTQPCIITSRVQDDLWHRFHSREAIEEAAVVERISDAQVREYLTAHLGDSKGVELYDRLNDPLRGLSRIPLLLWMIKEAGVAGEELPGNRGQLFDRFIDQVLRREQKQVERVTVAPDAKKLALSHLAFALHVEHLLTCDFETAIQIMDKAGVENSEVILRESLLNGLLMGERKLHFLHQSVHEYFAALRLRQMLLRMGSTEGWGSTATGFIRTMQLERELRNWAKDDWWSESFVQLAGLVDDPNALISTILPVRHWLAYWCIVEGQPVSEETEARVGAKTVFRLRAANVDERLRVVRELERMQNPRTIPHLISAFADESEAVVATASRTLLRLGQPAVDPLREALKTEQEGARYTAIRTLGSIWQFAEAIKLGDEDAAVRRHAARMLGRLGDRRATDVLIAAVYDSDREVQCLAAEALGNLGDVRATDALLDVLQHSYASDTVDCSLTRTISLALSKLGISSEEPLLAALDDVDETIRHRAMVTLGRMWQMVDLVDLANDKAEVRRQAALSLGNLEDKRVEAPLLAALRDRDEVVRHKAMISLGQVWQTAEITMLGSDEASSRQDAARALGNSNDPRVFRVLFAALRDSDKHVRFVAAKALRKHGAPDEVALVAILRDEDRHTRREAALSLAQTGGPIAVEALVSALHDERRYVREIALEGMSKMGDEAVEPLSSALQSQDPELQLGAAEALRRIGTVKAASVLHLHREKTRRTKASRKPYSNPGRRRGMP